MGWSSFCTTETSISGKGKDAGRKGWVFSNISPWRIHGTIVYLPRFTTKTTIHVGKYTSLMDGMGTGVFWWANFWELSREMGWLVFSGDIFCGDGKGLNNCWLDHLLGGKLWQRYLLLACPQNLETLEWHLCWFLLDWVVFVSHNPSRRIMILTRLCAFQIGVDTT